MQTAPRPDPRPDPPATDATAQMPVQADPAADPAAGPGRRTGPLRTRLTGGSADAAAKPPYAIVAHVRLVLGVMLTAMCVLTAGGALLFLMAWRQDQTSGLLASQTDRLWDVWDVLATVERYVALGAVPLGVVWIAVAALNVRRATGRRRNPLFAAVALAGGVAGVWYVGREIVAPASDDADWVGTVGGIALQAALAALPLLALERLADAAEARRRPARMAYVMTVGYLVVLQTFGALATIDSTTPIDGWGRAGTLVLIAALVQILAALAFTEAGRALEEGTQNRYELRHRFGESVLVQAGL